MLLAPGFFAALRPAFEQVPDLFSATAQIHFPPGVRREETGKTVFAQDTAEDFPVRCDLPLPGEDGSYVLYGSGGCSLYDTAKLRALGGVDEIYEPAYVEDLDLGYRAWQQGWPNVYVAGAAVEHRHRATTRATTREAELDHILEINYLRFVARAAADRRASSAASGAQALRRLFLRKGPLHEAAGIALHAARPAPRRARRRPRGPLPRPHRWQRQRLPRPPRHRQPADPRSRVPTSRFLCHMAARSECTT